MELVNLVVGTSPDAALHTRVVLGVFSVWLKKPTRSDARNTRTCGSASGKQGAECVSRGSRGLAYSGGIFHMGRMCTGLHILWTHIAEITHGA